MRWLHGVAFFIQFDAYALSFWGGRSALPAHALACLSCGALQRRAVDFGWLAGLTTALLPTVEVGIYPC